MKKDIRHYVYKVSIHEDMTSSLMQNDKHFGSNLNSSD